MKRVFKVKNANKTVRDVFINGLKCKPTKGDYKLTKNSIRILGKPLKKGDDLTYTQETTVVI